MAWKLDNIDFSTYGVIVTKSRGVFDLPEIDNEGYNWLDEDALDWWESDYDLRLKDREIELTCWIVADTFDDFVDRAIDFTNDLKASGTRQLTVPYLSSPVTCYVEKAMEIDRKSRYTDALQAGAFKLRLTVAGDSALKSLVVYKPDGTERQTIYYDKNLKLRQKFMVDDFIGGSVVSNTMFTLQKGDYVHLRHQEEFPGPKYFLFDDPRVKKLSSNKYECEVKFEHEFFKLREVQFRVFNQNDFSYYATADEVMTQIINNLDRRHSGKFQKATIATTDYKYHDFTGQNCMEVLQQLAEDYELEYHYKYDDGVSPVITIALEEKVNYTNVLTCQYGKANELYSITRETVNDPEFCTALYAEGSMDNLPADYGARRLQMPVESVEASGANIARYGYVEKFKIFDNIKPSRTGTLTGYTEVLTETEQEQSQFILQDTSLYNVNPALDIDINDYLVPNTSAKVVFQSGDLAGMEFELHRYDHDTQQMWIIQLVDEHGNKFPSATLKPAVGDTYKLIDIYLPSGYVTAAEQALQTAAEAHLADVCPPDVPYKVEVQPRAVLDYAVNDPLEESRAFSKIIPGNLVTVTDTDFGLSAVEKRVWEMELEIYTKKYTLTLADK